MKMAHEFKAELRSQEEWSWLVAIDLFLSGLGGGLFLLFATLDLPLFMALLSLALVMVGGLVLLAELGHPLRAWRAISRPSTSWISRGVIAISLFVVTGALAIAPGLDLFSWLPWTQSTAFGKILVLIAGAAAFFITLYPGFVLSASPSIPFWNSPLLPVLFSAHSLLGASGVVLLFSPFGPWVSVPARIESFAIWLIAANVILVAIYLITNRASAEAAREAVRRLTQGVVGWTFKIGVVLAGMLVPLLVMAYVPSGAVVAGALILIGGLLFRYCFLKAGVYVPFPLT
jgi:formate-dependent nitrite reductase membrane component NrfD